MKTEFVNHAHYTHETVAEIVGVQKDPCTYTRVRTLIQIEINP
jgi:DNA-binding XRE family transcriptional regulator